MNGNPDGSRCAQAATRSGPIDCIARSAAPTGLLTLRYTDGTCLICHSAPRGGAIHERGLDGLAKPGLRTRQGTWPQAFGLRETNQVVACATGRTTISSMSTCGGRVTAKTTQSATSSAVSGFSPS